nr:ribonuclease H-like domain-containing protein [Tanacetum cinerariifolium]
MADRLANLGEKVSDKNLVMYALNGLDIQYKGIARLIRHSQPLPKFETARNMLLLEESNLQEATDQANTYDSSSGLLGPAPRYYPTQATTLPSAFSTMTLQDPTWNMDTVYLYMHDPREPHFSALKRILRYVRGTLDYGLQLFASSTTSLVAYSNADWAGCPITRRSTSGYCVFLGNNLLSWSFKRQPTLSRFSAKAEYRGVDNAVAETC